MTQAPKEKPPIVERELQIPNIDIFGPRVLVTPYEPPQYTKGGLFLPPQAQERQQRGIVVGVGEGRITDSGQLVPCPVKLGDHVLYAKFGGAEIELEDEWGRKTKYLIIQQSDIYCRLFPDLEAKEVPAVAEEAS